MASYERGEQYLVYARPWPCLQVRNQETACSGKLAALGAASGSRCRSAAPSKASFGVDPVFRRSPASDGGRGLFNVNLGEYIEAGPKHCRCCLPRH